MSPRFSLSHYIEQAMAIAVYDKLKNHSFSGRIPDCTGVVAFASSLKECEDELRSTLEDWILVGLKMGHALPIISGIDLNNIPSHEPKGSTKIKEKKPLNGIEIKHRIVDAHVTQKQIVKYLHERGWVNLHESKLSRILNGKRRMPEKLEPALLNSIEKLRML